PSTGSTATSRRPSRSPPPTLLARIGWNSVRLLLSWSRVEPEPGRYDAAYLDEVAAAVDLLAARGIYTLADLHQDAWGPTLAAPPGLRCEAGATPAFGWDGAPGWATLDGGASRCAAAGIRELSPAVLTAFDAFWDDAPGPRGVGIQTRYVRMLGHVAGRFATRSAAPSRLRRSRWPWTRRKASAAPRCSPANGCRPRSIGHPGRVLLRRPPALAGRLPVRSDPVDLAGVLW
ncbi:MAG: cellulase family glycosylhydrolase, partial [Acidimicrobiia bacterium]|nr:cellulase family glycosylhydrolase [Acidimicrobiia bacterium]